MLVFFHPVKGSMVAIRIVYALGSAVHLKILVMRAPRFYKLLFLLVLALPLLMTCDKDKTKEKPLIHENGNADDNGETTPPPEHIGGQYFVAPTGSDNGPGSREQPWKSWNKAFKTAQAGDTVYFRGGVYHSSADNGGERDFNSGTDEKPICFFNFPGEIPILDCSHRPLDLGYNKGIALWHAQNIHMKGLQIRNVFQRMDAHAVGLEAWNVANITFENMTIHNVSGEGFLVADYHGTIRYLNCDAYALCDTLQSAVYPTPGSPGQNGAGFHFRAYSDTPGATESKLLYEGCRAWQFSDNGFAGTSVGYVEWNHCWAFNGGDFSGEGCGFKYASTYRENNTLELARVIKNCIGAHNGAYGFSPNNSGDAPMTGRYFHNTAYYNGYKEDIGHGLGYGWIIMQTNSPQAPEGELYANNLSYDNRKGNFHQVRTQETHDTHNSWNIDVALSDELFESVDWDELSRPRKSDGSLPDIAFMKPKSGTPLIDVGREVGLDFRGEAPDLGAFEIE